ncbi:hypothetical protein A9Q86_16005 [Flavobacteriales bacterium 33_180_T64]|nr:hypothetical protein A9Q86_16005 [Flavobacteriales bacterium 33_180_T64]
MSKVIVVIIGVFLCVLFSSCSSDDACSPGVIVITNLEDEYSCVNTAYEMDIQLVDEFIIIRSQSDFNNLVTGSCMPQIDFTTFDLLIGKQGLSNGVDTIVYDGIIRNCDDNQLYLTVIFIQNATTEAPNLTYHVLVPKLGATETINVSIDLN